MKGIIDRFEGELAVVELPGKRIKHIHTSVLPSGLKEGDVIVFTGGRWCFDETETTKRRIEIEKMFRDLLE